MRLLMTITVCMGAFMSSVTPFQLFSWLLPKNIEKNDTCSNVKVVEYIQQAQLRRLRKELGLPENEEYDISTSRFYHYSFGAMTVEAPKNKNNLTNLVYYRIWKNANDYIRELLYRYSHPLGEPLNTNPNCRVGECMDGDVNYLSSKALTSQHIPANSRRFAFTFVRNPLSRFVSAYTEIEYRLKQAKKEHSLPLFGTVGSVSRFQEFVHWIATTGSGTKRWLTEHTVEWGHVAPMIGTLHLAAYREQTPLHLYKLEDFNASWHKLAKDSSLAGLTEALRAASYEQHPSSSDPYKTTLAVKSFLAHTSELDYLRFFYQSHNSSNTSTACLDTVNCYKGSRVALESVPAPLNITALQAKARRYTRAVCRIYLVDYLCTGYDLPTVCSDLMQEHSSDLALFRARQLAAITRARKTQGVLSPLSWLFRTVAPMSLQARWADLYCVVSLSLADRLGVGVSRVGRQSPPECVSNLLYGEDQISGEDDYEELLDKHKHEEL